MRGLRGARRRLTGAVAAAICLGAAPSWPQSYPAKAEILDGHCAKVGRDPAAVERSAGVQAGDPEAMIAEAEALAALGVGLLTVGVNGPDYDLGPAQVLCRWRDGR